MAREWLQMVPRSKVPNKKCNSYHIKHVIEEWAGTYISNGACIAAALDLGIEIAACPGGLNAWFAIAGPKEWPKVPGQCEALI
jgi:hypothetical protein